MEAHPPHFSAGDYLHQAEMAGAPEYAPADYQRLAQEYSDLEKLYKDHNYETFDKNLPHFVEKAEQLIELSRKNIDSSSVSAPELETLSENPPLTPPNTIKRETSVKIEEERTLKLRSSYIVTEGELLWTIAKRPDVYGDPLLWPLLYQANRDQIKDPRKIYAGQTLSIPRNVSEEEKENARHTAKKSTFFSP